MRIEDDMKEALENGLLDDEPLVPPWIKKLFIKVVAVLLVLLMLSFIYLNYPIIGQLVSQPVTANTLELKDITVHFSDEPLNMITQSYKSELETPMCLQGTKIGGEYYVNNAYIPRIYSQSRTHVSHVSCEETLIIFHTHPYKSCLASATDLNTLGRNQETDPDIIMIVMCEPNRFSLYR